MADVFISYAREDRALAEQVARALQARGVESFWDVEIPPGQAWDDYLASKLAGCRAVVVLWSQHSTKSEWVREEARMGKERAQLIPAMIDGTPPPFGFGGVQAANLVGWSGDPNHPEWRRLADAVQAAVGGAAPAPQPAPQQWSPPPQPHPHPQPWTAPPQPRASGAATSPIAYIQTCFRLYIDGKGRARRAEYAWWAAFVVGVSVVLTILEGALFGLDPLTSAPLNQTISTIFSLAILAPSVSVTSRRLHDLGYSGWLAAALYGVGVGGSLLSLDGNELGLILGFLTLVAVIALAAMPGKAGANQYGPDPKA